MLQRARCNGCILQLIQRQGPGRPAVYKARAPTPSQALDSPGGPAWINQRRSCKECECACLLLIWHDSHVQAYAVTFGFKCCCVACARGGRMKLPQTRVASGPAEPRGRSANLEFPQTKMHITIKQLSLAIKHHLQYSACWQAAGAPALVPVPVLGGANAWSLRLEGMAICFLQYRTTVRHAPASSGFQNGSGRQVGRRFWPGAQKAAGA